MYFYLRNLKTNFARGFSYINKEYIQKYFNLYLRKNGIKKKEINENMNIQKLQYNYCIGKNKASKNLKLKNASFD